MEWIRFFITAALLLLGMISFISAVIGVYRFGFVMNRMHAAGIGVIVYKKPSILFNRYW